MSMHYWERDAVLAESLQRDSRSFNAEKTQVVEMDELDTQGFAEKRKEFRKIFFE